MAKSVKLFQQVEKVFQSLGIRTAQPKLYDRISVKCYILLMSLSIISNSSMVYLLFAAKSTVADRGDAFYIGTSQYSNIFYIITYIREAPKLRHLIGKFEIFFEEKLNDPATEGTFSTLHEKTDRLCRWAYVGFVKITAPLFMLPVLFATIFNYFVLHLREESFILGSPFYFPLNVQSWPGYTIAFAIESVSCFASLSSVVPLMSLFCGSCWILTAMGKDVTMDLRALNRCKLEKAKPSDVERRFGNVIKRFSGVKQMVHEFQDVYKYLILNLFLWSMLSICCNLLVLQSNLQSANDSNMVDVVNDDVKRINLCFWSFVNIYAFCELGHTVTNQFDDFEVELDQCKWYLFDCKLQRTFLIFVTIAEQPTTISGYGDIECIRVSLKKTISSSFSYFMAIRQFE